MTVEQTFIRIANSFRGSSLFGHNTSKSWASRFRLATRLEQQDQKMSRARLYPKRPPFHSDKTNTIPFSSLRNATTERNNHFGPRSPLSPFLSYFSTFSSNYTLKHNVQQLVWKQETHNVDSVGNFDHSANGSTEYHCQAT